MSFEVQANQVNRRSREGFLGQWAWDSHLKRYDAGINKAPQAKNVWTFAVSDPGDAQDLVLRFTLGNGGTVVDVPYNTGTGLAAAAIAAGIVDAINAESLVRGQVVATVVSTTVTLTALWPGIGFTPSAPTNPGTMISSITETVNEAVAAAIEVGRATIFTGFNSSYAGTEPEKLLALAASSAFTAQVITWTPTYVAAARYGVGIYEVRNGERILLARSEEVGATDLNATLDALEANLNALLPANTVLVAATPATATAMTFTAEIAGLEIDVEVTISGDGASMPTSGVAYTTGPSPATSLHRAWAGLAIYSMAEETTVVGGEIASYAANQGVIVAQVGKVNVANAEATRPSLGETVFAELGAGSDTGKLFRAGSSSRVALARDIARWERAFRTADNLGMAVVRLGPGF